MEVEPYAAKCWSVELSEKKVFKKKPDICFPLNNGLVRGRSRNMGTPPGDNSGRGPYLARICLHRNMKRSIIELLHEHRALSLNLSAAMASNLLSP